MLTPVLGAAKVCSHAGPLHENTKYLPIMATRNPGGEEAREKKDYRLSQRV